MCVVNSTIPSCVPKKSKGKVGIIVGVVAGTAALILAALAIAYFVRSKKTRPVAAGDGIDYMNASLLENPTYATSGAGLNPIYNDDL